MILNPGAPRQLDADGAFNLGLDALDSGREAQALQVMAAATSAFPRDPRLWQVTGLLHRALDDLAPAVSALAKAAALAPHDARIAQGHAHAALEAGLPAVALFEKLVRLTPQDDAVRLGLAAADLAEAGPQAAVERLDAHLAQQPHWLDGHWLSARLKGLAGEREGLTESLDRVVRSDPADGAAWQQLIFILMHAGRHEAALAAIATARRAVGLHPAFDASEAACLSETWQLEAADRCFAALPPASDAVQAVPLVRHLLRTGRPDRAAAKATECASRPGGHLVLPYLSLAWRVLADPRSAWLDGDPRCIGVYDIGASLPPLGALADRLRALHVAVGQPLEQSVRGGTQTDGALLSRIEPEIRALRQAIVAAVEAHVARLPARDPTHPFLAGARQGRVRFAGSWSVRLAAQGHHTPHVHPAGWLSSALYVALPDEGARGPAPAGWLSLGEPPAELGLDLPALRLVEPRPGRLVLFPSTMWHGTRPFAQGERLTVAFDVAPLAGPVA